MTTEIPPIISKDAEKMATQEYTLCPKYGDNKIWFLYDGKIWKVKMDRYRTCTGWHERKLLQRISKNIWTSAVVCFHMKQTQSVRTDLQQARWCPKTLFYRSQSSKKTFDNVGTSVIPLCYVCTSSKQCNTIAFPFRIVEVWLYSKYWQRIKSDLVHHY